MNEAERLAELYAELPAIVCQGKCAHSCKGIAVPRGEFRRMTAARPGVRFTARSLGPFLEICASNRPCPYLSDGRCSIYASRPMICRMWGVARTMPCPHGCKPERWLDQGEEAEFVRRLKEIETDGDHAGARAARAGGAASAQAQRSKASLRARISP